MEEEVGRDINSLMYWFPKVKDLGIPVPKTEWQVISNEHLRALIEERFPE